MARFNEKETLENYMVDQLTSSDIGWKFISTDDLERDSFEEPLLLRNLMRKIKCINKTRLSSEDLNNVIKALKFKGTTQDGIKEILNYLKNGVSIKLERERTLERVQLFDYDNIENNEFIVTRQSHYINGEDHKIMDIVLYVNGIPLVNIECKNPTSFSEDWANAFKDIKEYEKAVPEVYKYIQIGVAAAEVARYFPVVPWQDDIRQIKVGEWKEEGLDSIDATIKMLSCQNLLDIIRNYLFYRIEFGNATKVITRYMQFRAVNKIAERVEGLIAGKEEKRRGLIWHWQGSGKTLEMIFAAYKLYHDPALENPTIFFIVDRRELEEQLSDEFNALDITKPEVIGSIEELKKIVAHDGYKGRRGLFITLVHKFRPEELSELDKHLTELSAKQETLKTRGNVVAFIDEGHRTQSGGMAAQMKSLLGEDTTFFFAFTGTPICKPEKGIDTYRDFSYLPEEKYIDKYFITESWQDEFTVRIAYKPALADKEGIHLNAVMLDNFLKEKYQEIPEDIRESVEEGIKEKLSIVKAYLENPERIKMVAESIADHFKKNIDGKYKALVVAVSREACVMYKRELDKHLPPEYSEIVMSYSDKKDSDAIKKYKAELIKRHNGMETDDIKKELINKFKEDDLPKIFIVKDMLLTGFNVPILQTMYLDQPLKEHRLLQAIARTNRPYKGVKEAGLIVDYIGILKDFNRAFEIYTQEEVKDVLYSVDELKKEFLDKLTQLLSIFDSLPKDKVDRKTLLQAIEILTFDEALCKHFLGEFKTLRKLFELLGSETIKAEKALEYGWLSQIYASYIKIVLARGDDEKLYIEQYYKKTVDFIHKTTELKELDNALPAIEFNEKYIEVLDEKAKGKEEKAANLVFTLNRYVLVDRQKNTIYETVAERVEKLLDTWKQKAKNFEEIYNEGLAIWDDMMSIKARQKDLGFDDISYNLLLILEHQFGKQESLIDDVKELYDGLDGIIGLKTRKFSNWATQVTVRKNVEKTIRKGIRKYVREYGLRIEDMEQLYQKLIDHVVKHG